METRHLLRGVLVTEVIGVPAPTQQALQFSDSMFVGGLGHVASGDRSDVAYAMRSWSGRSFLLSVNCGLCTKTNRVFSLVHALSAPLKRGGGSHGMRGRLRLRGSSGRSRLSFISLIHPIVSLRVSVFL